MSRDHLILAVTYWPTGSTASGWRTRAAYNGGIFKPGLLVDAARTAERGIFDYFFLGNSYFSDSSQPGSVVRRAFQINGFATAAFLASHTRHIGLMATINTVFLEPFHIAQIAASIDHLSEGRFGLNLVTGVGNDPSYRNFSLGGHPEPADKYARATEFAEAFNRLEDSWDDDWFLDDREGGRLINDEAAHPIDFDGEYFQIEGPLNAPRPPQGRIPLATAGTSPESFDFAGRFADVRFSPFVSLAWNQDYRARNRAKAREFGRDADALKIVVGTVFYPGETTQEARRVFREVEAAVVEDFGPQLIAKTLGVPAEQVTPHGRIVDVLGLDVVERDGSFAFETNRHQAIGASGINVNLREVFEAYGSTEVTFLDLFRFLVNKNHFPVVVGDRRRIADWIQEGYEAEAFDGVKFFPPFQRQPFDVFVDQVVPELQRRGLARKSYDTSTFRAHLGLDRPASAPRPTRETANVGG